MRYIYNIHEQECAITWDRCQTFSSYKIYIHLVDMRYIHMNKQAFSRGTGARHLVDMRYIYI